MKKKKDERYKKKGRAIKKKDEHMEQDGMAMKKKGGKRHAQGNGQYGKR